MGLTKIVAIRAAMNNGLSKVWIEIFPDVKPVPRPLVELREIIDPNWLAGFVNGDGCFHISISKFSKIKGVTIAGYILRLVNIHVIFRYWIVLLRYLGCGRLCKSSTRATVVEFVVTKLSDLDGKIIPFFKKYPLHGKKGLDFEDFCKQR